MILKDINLVFIVLPFVIGGIFYSKISRFKTGDVLRDSIKNLQIMIMMTAVMCAIMLFLLPFTPGLSSFDFPYDLKDIDNQQKLLNLLQEYNRAIVRTTEVVFWLLFILVFWIATSVYQLLQLFKNRVDEQIIAKKNEETV